MAGTRRRSRISETAAAVQLHQRSAARIAATVDDAEKVVEVAESVDHDSPRPPSQPPANRSATGICKRCQNEVGHFFNSWHRITGSYYLPALLGSYSSRLKEHGRQKAASITTDLDGW
jgi:hypothetical protein